MATGNFMKGNAKFICATRLEVSTRLSSGEIEYTTAKEKTCQN